jgi:phosphoribosyl-AMP cyclohydrolase
MSDTCDIYDCDQDSYAVIIKGSTYCHKHFEQLLSVFDE